MSYVKFYDKTLKQLLGNADNSIHSSIIVSENQRNYESYPIKN